jgi:hypothetical protein
MPWWRAFRAAAQDHKPTLGVEHAHEEEDDRQEAHEEGHEEGRSGAQALRQEDDEGVEVVVVAAP